MAQLRIFSYLPNPRVWKATITARLCDVDVEVHGAKGHELADWLWDFDARPLSEDDRANRDLSRQGHTGFRTNLFKTDAFLEAHPWGTVPAAFSPDGSIGIFESNSIMRAVARIGASNYPAYGTDPYTASRIDSFLDASLVFARDCQIYLLALGGGSLTPEVYQRAKDAFHTYLSGIDQALDGSSGFLVGSDVTLADVCFAAEIALFSRERAWANTVREMDCEPINWDQHPRAIAHYDALSEHPAFAPELRPFRKEVEANIRKHAD